MYKFCYNTERKECSDGLVMRHGRIVMNLTKKNNNNKSLKDNSKCAPTPNADVIFAWSTCRNC